MIAYRKARLCWRKLSFDKGRRVKVPTCWIVWNATVFDIERSSMVVVVGRIR